MPAGLDSKTARRPLPLDKAMHELVRGVRVEHILNKAERRVHVLMAWAEVPRHRDNLPVFNRHRQQIPNNK